MKTIRDLFIKNKRYIVNFRMGRGYILFIECLDKFDCAINGALNIETLKYDFDEDYLTDNILVEIHNEYHINDTYCDVNIYDLTLDTPVETLRKLAMKEIEEIEKNINKGL